MWFPTQEIDLRHTLYVFDGKSKEQFMAFSQAKKKLSLAGYYTARDISLLSRQARSSANEGWKADRWRTSEKYFERGKQNFILISLN